MTTDTAEAVADFSTASSQAALATEPPITFPKNSPLQRAWQDIVAGTCNWPLWLMLAYQDIKLRYRRSVLGPFWITLSMAITVYAMGFLYGHLFHIDLPHYYPFLVTGMLSWTLIQTIIIEANDTFEMMSATIKQVKLPYSLHIHRIVARNLIIFFHNILVIIPVMVIYHATMPLNAYTLLVIPGLALIYIAGVIYGLILAMLGARYRDISQMVKSLIQVIFFLTPVMWNPATISGTHNMEMLVYWNPFYSFLQMLRAPLLGQAPTLLNLMIVLGVMLVGAVASLCLLARYRARIIYWL